MEKWIAEVVGSMHINRITQGEIAKELHVTSDYISMILRGKKNPKNAEKRIRNAIDAILQERKVQNADK